MRVIGGSARSRQLTVPAVPGLRPTSDRVREAVFDILTSRGAIEGASVLDGFAGSGALGIEALSRGASAVTFVDVDRRALAGVEHNLAATGLGAAGAVTLVRADLVEWLGRASAPTFDVALLDPPYPFDDWSGLLGRLAAEIALLESARPVAVPDGYAVRREYRYGGTLVTLVEAAGPAPRASRPSDKDTF